jgi:tetratricopeptide (TPR) repeat protein
LGYGAVIAAVGFFWAIGLARAADEAPAPDGLLGTAVQHAVHGRYAEAEAACRKAIQQEPGIECYARLVLADVCRAQGRIKDAEQEAQKALEAAAREPKDDAGAAMAKKALESFKKEEEDWQARLPEAFFETKGQSGVLHGADMLAAAGRYGEAMGLCEALASGTPDKEPIVVSALDRLTLYTRQAQGEQAALARLGKLAQAQKGTLLEAYAALKIAEVLDAGGKPEAIQAYERVASMKQGAKWAPTALERVFCIHERAGRQAEALAVGDRLLAAYPSSPAAVAVLPRLTRHHREAGDLDAFLWRVTQEDLGLSADGLAALARACIDENRMSEAKVLIERLRQKYPASPLGPVVLMDFYERALPAELLADASLPAPEGLTDAAEIRRRCGLSYRAAVTWMRAAQADKAKAALTQAEALFPRSEADSDLLIRRAYTLMLMGTNKEEAVAAMEQARAAAPKDPAMWLGKIRLEAAKAREALPKDGQTAAEVLRAAEMLGEMGAPGDGLAFLESVDKGVFGPGGETLQRRKAVEVHLLELMLTQAMNDLAEADKGLRTARVVAGLATDPADKEKKLAVQRGFEERVAEANARIKGLQVRLNKAQK